MTEPARTPPQVRQCRDPEHYLFGATAVAAGLNQWGVMHPRNGGHWAADADVADWTVLHE